MLTGSRRNAGMKDESITAGNNNILVTVQNRLKILRIFRCLGFIQYINL